MTWLILLILFKQITVHEGARYFPHPTSSVSMELQQCIDQDDQSKLREFLRDLTKDQIGDITIYKHEEPCSLLTYATTMKNIEIAKLLIDSPKIDVNHGFMMGERPLEACMAHNISEICLYILKKRQDLRVNELTEGNNYYLQRALLFRKMEVFEALLLRSDTNINQQQKDGCSVYALSIRFTRMEFFLRLDREPSIQRNQISGDFGTSPLLDACNSGNFIIVERLLQLDNLRSTIESQIDHDGRNALTNAIIRRRILPKTDIITKKILVNKTRTVQILLQSAPNLVNHYDKDYKTPLMMLILSVSVRLSDLQIIDENSILDLLIQQTEIDLWKTDKEGKNVLDYAYEVETKWKSKQPMTEDCFQSYRHVSRMRKKIEDAMKEDIKKKYVVLHNDVGLPGDIVEKVIQDRYMTGKRIDFQKILEKLSQAKSYKVGSTPPKN